MLPSSRQPAYHPPVGKTMELAGRSFLSRFAGEEAKKTSAIRAFADGLGSWGEYHSSFGRIASAHVCFRAEARARGRLAGIYQSGGRFAAASVTWKEAAEARVKAGMSSGYESGMVHFCDGCVYAARENYDDAATEMQSAYRLLLAAFRPQKAFEAGKEAARFLFLTGQGAKAVEFCISAASDARKIYNIPMAIEFYNVGLIFSPDQPTSQLLKDLMKAARAELRLPVKSRISDSGMHYG